MQPIVTAVNSLGCASTGVRPDLWPTARVVLVRGGGTRLEVKEGEAPEARAAGASLVCETWSA